MPDITVRLPFTYKQLYKENPRQRNDREREVTVTLPITVTAVDASDAPLTLRGPHVRHRSYGGQFEYRHHAGQLYIQDYNATFAEYIDRHKHDLRPPAVHTDAQVSAHVTQKLREWGVIVIDGRAYHPTDEPVYLTYKGGHVPRVDTTTIDADGEPYDLTARERQGRHVFRMDELELAKSTIHAEARRTHTYIEVGLRLEVLRPDLLQYGRMRPFTVRHRVSVDIDTTVLARNAVDARDQAMAIQRQHFKETTGQDVTPQEQSTTPLTGPDGLDASLNGLSGGPRHVDLPGELRLSINERAHMTVTRKHETVDFPVPPIHSDALLLAATLLIVSPLGKFNEPLNMHLAPLRTVTAEQLTGLAAAYGPHATRLMHRAARDLLTAHALYTLTDATERALWNPDFSHDAAD